MKRFAVVLATTGLVATTLGVGALALPASADGGLTVTIAGAGTKKVDVAWDVGSSLVTDPFDAYLVTLDNDSNSTAATADRSRFVDDDAARSVRFEDLNANTTYYAKVYAVDYQADSVVVVPPTGQGPGTALGSATGAYSPLTITASTFKVLSGKTVSLSGTLRDDSNAPISGATVSVLRDVYPQFGGSAESTTQTDANGKWSIASPVLSENTWFWAEYRAEGDVGGWTGRILVEVRKKISVQVAPALTVNAGTNVKFSGNVNGDPAFLDASVKVCLQRLEGGNWRKLFCSAIEPNGDYLLTLKSPGAKADGKYRVFSGMGPAYGDSWSPSKKLVVN